MSGSCTRSDCGTEGASVGTTTGAVEGMALNAGGNPKIDATQPCRCR